MALSYFDRAQHAGASTALAHIRNGTSNFDWTFASQDDLIPASLGQFDHISLTEERLDLTSPGVNAFISLNFRGQVARADLHKKLEIHVNSDRATKMLVFHSPSPNGPVHATTPVAIEQGSQIVSLATDRLTWQALYFPEGDKRTNRREQSQWGGGKNRIWSLRIHPATTPGTKNGDRPASLCSREAESQSSSAEHTLAVFGVFRYCCTNGCVVPASFGWLPARILTLQHRCGSKIHLPGLFGTPRQHQWRNNTPMARGRACFLPWPCFWR